MIKDCRILFNAFGKFMQEIWDDIIFAGMMFVPILIAFLFKFGIPSLENFLCENLQLQAVISPYYICFDLCLIMMTPMMFSFLGVMVVLGEIDNGMAKYLMVTPLGRSGYLWSRIGILSVTSMIYGCILTSILSISDISILEICYCGIIAAFTGISISFFVIAIAHNKVEGIALTKFSSILILGIPLSAFVNSPIRYTGFLFPSFWATEFCIQNNALAAFAGILSSLFLVFISFLLFRKKIL